MKDDLHAVRKELTMLEPGGVDGGFERTVWRKIMFDYEWYLVREQLEVGLIPNRHVFNPQPTCV